MVTMVASTIGALIYNNHRFDALNKRLDDLGASLNKRIDDLGTSLRAEMNARFLAVEKRFDDLKVEMNTRFSAVDKRFDDLKDLLRSEIKRLEERLARERITR